MKLNIEKALKRAAVTDHKPETEVLETLACHERLIKRFASLSERATLVALAPGTGKSTLAVLLNEAFERNVDPVEFVQLHIGKLPKLAHYSGEKLREVMGFAPPAVWYFADADVVFDSSDPYWKTRIEEASMNQAQAVRRPLGAYEEIVLDFWEQVEPSQLPRVLLMNFYGGEQAPWFALRAKLPFKEMEGRWRGRISPDVPEHEAEIKIRRWRSAWHDLPGDVLDFSEIVHVLVSLATAFPKQ